MIKDECKANFKDTKIVDCDPCRHFYFKRSDAIKLSTGTLIVTSHYDFKTCFEGLGKGPYLNTMTLLPSESLDLEIIRRSKYTKELHEESSIESEFEQSFEETTREKFTRTNNFSFESTVGGGFSLFGNGVKASATVSASVKSSYELFNEIVQTTSSKVSRKYDIAIDVKTEKENQFRSLRKIKNPNPCHPVLFIMSQIMKSYKSELILLRVEYDYIPEKVPQVFSESATNLKFLRPLLVPFNNFISRVSSQKIEVSTSPRILTNVLNQEEIKIAEPNFRELSKDVLLDLKIPNLSKEALEKSIDEILKKPEFTLGVKFSRQYCLRTSDIHIETKISPCSACCQEDCNSEDSTNIEVESEA